MTRNSVKRDMPANLTQEPVVEFAQEIVAGETGSPVTAHLVQEEPVIQPAPVKQQVQETPEELTRRKRKERLKTPIRGIFRFLQCPGGELKFPFKFPFKGERVQRFTLVDGETCTIPLAVAIHLNKNCAHEVSEERYDENNKLVSKVNKMIHRTMFQPLEFMDIDELNPSKNSLSTVSF